MAMTTQGILVLTGIVSAFLFFGITLAWADFYSQGGRKPGVEESSAVDERRDERRAA
jgi:hypothetical protein